MISDIYDCGFKPDLNPQTLLLHKHEKKFELEALVMTSLVVLENLQDFGLNVAVERSIRSRNQ